tara:strand:- start:10054 stop:10593 length:540 start_codon:yes stop_codon:yes gene_type:complete
MKTEETNFEKCYNWLLTQDKEAAEYYKENTDVSFVDGSKEILAINRAFYWSATPQGDIYWSILSTEWIDYLEDLEYAPNETLKQAGERYNKIVAATLTEKVQPEGVWDTKDNINPDHYKTEGKEVWEMMIAVYGVTHFKAFCELNAFKYRLRAGKKGDNALEDIKKALWYEDKIKEVGE